ncbi:MAG: hypothetical protein ACRDPW_09290 [Mycobacteriales bacterium]
MTGYKQIAAPAIGSRTDAVRERLPSWARRIDPRLLIVGAVVVVFGLCCCCGGAFALTGWLGTDGETGGGSRPASERSVEPSEPGSPEPGSSAPSDNTPSPNSDASSRQPSSAATATPKQVSVPAVVGKNAAVASDELERAGFTKVRFASEDPDHRVVILPQNWKVTKQSASPRSSADPDAVFVLTCTKLA